MQLPLKLFLINAIKIDEETNQEIGKDARRGGLSWRYSFND